MVLHITPRERLTLRLLAAGIPVHEMASQLGTSEFELELQLRTLFARMGAASPADAVAGALRRGLLASPGSADHLDSGDVDFPPSRSTYM